MSYVVHWLEAVLEALADIWLRARDRMAVTNAVVDIDALLAWNPHTVGENAGPHRVLCVLPLAVAFLIDDAARKVYVTQVWRDLLAEPN